MRTLSLTRETAAATGIASTTGSELLFGGNHREVRLIEELMGAARSVWPRKTSAELASRLGVSTRAADKWLAAQNGMTGEQLAGLLRSDHPMIFLRATVGPNYPIWRALRNEHEALFLREEIARLKVRLRD